MAINQLQIKRYRPQFMKSSFNLFEKTVQLHVCSFFFCLFPILAYHIFSWIEWMCPKTMQCSTFNREHSKEKNKGPKQLIIVSFVFVSEVRETSMYATYCQLSNWKRAKKGFSSCVRATHISFEFQLSILWYIKLNISPLTPAGPHYHSRMPIEHCIVHVSSEQYRKRKTITKLQKDEQVKKGWRVELMKNENE